MANAALPNSLEARDIASLLHPYTDALENEALGPLVIARGDGACVFDTEGNRYLEAMAGLWCASLGFANDRLAEAAASQIRTLGFYHGFSRKSHEPQIALAEKLLSLAPVPMGRVFFTNSGSEANDTAIKLAWYYNEARGKPDKRKIVGRVRGYHGVTVAAASVTGTPPNHAGFGLPLPGFLHADCPHYYRFAEPGESEADFASHMAGNLDRLIEAEGPDTVAAFFAEPVMGAGGVLLPPETYFEKIQAVLKKHDVLFVCDEVITGFGRTGNLWGSQTYGLKPDIITCAKALSAGTVPIAAVMMAEPIYRTVAEATAKYGTFGHGFTYSGHPVPAAVALETLKIYEEIGIVDRVRRVAPRFQAGLAALGQHPLVGEAGGVGLVGAVELVRNKETREPFPPALKVGPGLAARAQAHGLIVRAMGDRIAFAPPLIVSEAEIDEIFAKTRLALDETAAWAATI